MFPTDARRTRAGWAVYVTDGHPLNARGHLHGLHQTSFRAELAAIAHAVATVRGPVHVVTDCQAAAEGVKAIILGGDPPGGSDLDLWQEIARLIARRGADQLDITWVKSHVAPELCEQVEQAGGFEKIDLDANNSVDVHAKEAVAGHRVEWKNYLAADDREVAANIIQRMMVVIWSDFFSLYERAWDDSDLDEAEGDGDVARGVGDIPPPPSRWRRSR